MSAKRALVIACGPAFGGTLSSHMKWMRHQKITVDDILRANALMELADQVMEGRVT